MSNRRGVAFTNTRFVRKALKRYTIEKLGNERLSGILERTIMFKQLGMAAGSCALVASVFLAIAAYTEDSAFYGCIAAAAFVSAIVLIHLGWLKLMQQAQWAYRIWLQVSDDTKTGTTPGSPGSASAPLSNGEDAPAGSG